MSFDLEHMSLCAAEPSALREQLRLSVNGRVTAVLGLTLEGTCPGAALGDTIQVRPVRAAPVLAEVIGLRGGKAIMVPLGHARGIATGDKLTHVSSGATLACSDSLLGRVVDATGQPLDARGPVPGPFTHRALYGSPPSPLERGSVNAVFSVGVRAIDGLLTLGRGQRIGIFAGAGVGKSRLMGMLTGGADCDVNVVALIGERGREVAEFVRSVLPTSARHKTVVVAATSSESPLERMRGAFVATAIAEHFALQGKTVMLLMDSLTRFAMAQRELGLALGEPPATRGYTPSVFAMMPRLLERAGSFAGAGSITGIYTVLMEGDDLNDPVADCARSILDGHIVLDRHLAERGHFPAIDVLASVSRVADQVTSPTQTQLTATVRQRLADLREVEELVSIGAYAPGAAPALDRALQAKQSVMDFLRQNSAETSSWIATVKRLTQLGAGR